MTSLGAANYFQLPNGTTCKKTDLGGSPFTNWFCKLVYIRSTEGRAAVSV